MDKSLLKTLLLGFFVFLFASCNKFGDDWNTTKTGIKIYHQSESFLGGDYSWTGDTLYMGVANGKGVLSYEDNINKKNNFKKNTTLHYGSLKKPIDLKNFAVGDIDKEGKLNGFGVLAKNGEIIISKFKKSKAEGEGAIYQDDKIKYIGVLKDNKPDGEGKLFYANGMINYIGVFDNGVFDGTGKLYSENGSTIYNGEFKDGKFNGKGKLYCRNGVLLYEGKFKDGLYNGYGILTDTLNGRQIIHIWNAGALDKATAKVYRSLEQHKLSYTPTQYKKIVNRFVAWERYHVWMYIGWGILAAFILLIGLGQLEEDCATRYDRAARWKKRYLWATWLMFGWSGAHRFILKSKFGVIFSILFSALICLQMRNLSLYLFYPSTWNMWETNMATNIVLVLIAVLLVFDFFYIPIRCYNLNREYYRHDKNEDVLVKKQTSPLVIFGETIPMEVSNTRTEIADSLKSVKRIQSNKYKGKTGYLAKAGRAIIGNDPWLDHELRRTKKLQDILQNIKAIQDNYTELCERLNNSMEESRNNAYRNLKLAKEIIALAVPSKSKRQELIRDTELRIESSQTLELPISQLESVSVSVDWDKTVKKSVTSTMTLMKMGVKGPWAIGLGAGLSLLDSIGEAMNRADKAREECEKACAAVVDNLSEASSSILKAEASMLRYSEVIIALNKSNEIFWQTYAPLRDQVFAKDFSLREFIRGPRIDSALINNTQFKNDIAYLAVICSEYNKINQSKTS